MADAAIERGRQRAWLTIGLAGGVAATVADYLDMLKRELRGLD